MGKIRVKPLVLALIFNLSVYGGARVLSRNWQHYNIESWLDGLIPFWPPSVAIYLGCYLFWAANYVIISCQGKQEVCRFFSGDLISRMVCFAFYCLFPSTNTRPAVEPEGFWNQVMIALYSVDAADNLFPSIHCLVSWFSYIGIRGKKNIPAWYRAFSCLFAILVCISTLTTKQHVIWDVLGGIGLAEICLAISKYPKVWGTYEKFFLKSG